MFGLGKKFVITLIFILVALGLLLVTPVVAPVTMPEQPKSGPEISSVEIHHNPIWKPPTNWTDPYTGQVLSSTPGRWIQNGSIEITIKNRPCTPYTDENGNYINVYYCYFHKGYGDGWLGGNSGAMGSSNNMLPYAVYQSDSSYTVITSLYYDDNRSERPSAELSFRIQAVERGYFVLKDENFAKWVYEGEGSEWIEFTITIPYSDTPGTSKPAIQPAPIVPSTSNPSTPLTPDTPSISNPTNTSVPQNPLWSNLIIILVSVCIIAILLVIIVYLLFSRHRKYKHKRKFVAGDIGCGVERKDRAAKHAEFLPVW
jgi:hypothetical protein